MAFVSVPKDLNKVKTKLALNLTKRQLICFGLAAVIGIPTYLFTRAGIGNMGAMLLMIVLMLPFFFFAMYERDGQPAEQIVKHMLRHRFWPGARPYKTENLYLYLEKEEKNLAGKQMANRAATTSARKRTTGKGKQG